MNGALSDTRPPLDLGNGLACASFAPDGAWLSMGTVHPDHGFVELNGLPPFDEQWRGDPPAVRRFRDLMTQEQHAFLRVAGDDVRWMAASVPDHGRSIVQRISDPGGTGLRLRFDGRLDRPALAEITETDPPQPTGTHTIVEAHGDALVVRAPELSAEARIRVRMLGVREGTVAGAWQVQGSGAELAVLPSHGGPRELEIVCTLSVPGSAPDEEVPAAGQRRIRAADHREAPIALHVPARLRTALDELRARSVEYVRGCTALRVGPNQCAILTDHRILPLSWTRDAYWQALLLLRAEAERGATMVADHLRWLWLRCERPDGAWVRSHHADGRRKDLPFQIDQQLYPLLELADFVNATGEPPALPRSTSWRSLVEDAWRPVARAMDDRLGFARTAENPADDRADRPFLLSAQVLLWHTATRIEAVAGAFGTHPAPFGEVAASLRDAVQHHFVRRGPFGQQWAYAIDGHGGSELYQDANDLPTALAPLWGFCPATEGAWRATMSYAFSEANPGFVPGLFGGLGSRHTPGTWPLGDIQRWVAGSLGGDVAVAEAALDRLVAVTTRDGLLPEAYDPADGAIVARPWFAWPGAALGALSQR